MKSLEEQAKEWFKSTAWWDRVPNEYSEAKEMSLATYDAHDVLEIAVAFHKHALKELLDSWTDDNIRDWVLDRKDPSASDLEDWTDDRISRHTLSMVKKWAIMDFRDELKKQIEQ